MEPNEDLDKLLLEIGSELGNIDEDVVQKQPILRDDDTFANELIQSCHTSNANNNLNQSTNTLMSQKDSEKSLVRDGNVDSSDDEDIQNFLEQKYNEYGKNVRSNLKKQNEEQIDRRITNDVERSIKTLAKPKPIVPQKHEFPEYKPKPAAIKKCDNVGIYTDPIFGIRIVHPLISSAQIQERMVGRIPIPMCSIRRHLDHGDLSKDWAVAGVIVRKSAINTSKKGSQYVIWKLSDLRGDIKTISLFLFKNAYKEMWKISQGMVVALLNPGVMDNSKDKTDEACLSVDNPQKFMILGQSKDLGTCRSRKKNGEMCTSIVNLGTCEYCVYHIKQEYSKMSGRSELQSSTAGRGLEALRNKVLGKSEVFYGGQSFLAVPAKKNPKLLAKDRKRLQMLSEQYQSTEGLVTRDNNRLQLLSPQNQTVAGMAQAVNYIKGTNVDTKIAAGVDANVSQRLKDLERLKQLDAMNQKRIANDVEKTLPKSDVELKKPIMPLKTPTLSRSSFSIDLSASSRTSNLAKQRALEILKKKPIEKSNPNFIKYRGTSEGKKRANDDLTCREPNEIKKQKLATDVEKFRQERIQKIMETKSSHSDLIVEHANEAQEKYFSKQLKKEAMEEKMLSTFEIDCKAVVCLKCRYTAFSSADRCKNEGHPIKVIDAKKRFFECVDCHSRTATVHRMPQISCKNCQGSRWKRTAMIKERVTERVGEQLSIRGDEEMFLGSLQGSGNISLCVAED